MNAVHPAHAHPVHWAWAIGIAIVVLLASGIGWTWVESGGLERHDSSVSVKAPSLPVLKVPAAPRPAG